MNLFFIQKGNTDNHCFMYKVFNKNNLKESYFPWHGMSLVNFFFTNEI